MAALADELFERQHAAVVGFDLVFAEPELRPDADAGASALRAAGRPAARRASLPAADGAGFYHARSAPACCPRRCSTPAALGGRSGGLTRWSGHVANVAPLAAAAPRGRLLQRRCPTSTAWCARCRWWPSVAGQPPREPGAGDVARCTAIRRRCAPCLPASRRARRRLRAWSPSSSRRARSGCASRWTRAAACACRSAGPAGPRAARSSTCRPPTCSKAAWPPGSLSGKLVLVGSSAPGVFDLRSTPVAAVYPGVEVHANLLSGLLDGRGPVVPDWARGYEVAQLLVVTALLALLLPRLRAASRHGRDAGPGRRAGRARPVALPPPRPGRCRSPRRCC